MSTADMPTERAQTDPFRRAARPVIAGIALGRLRSAVRARKVLANGGAEALHDLRVDLRRLRAVLRAYQPELAGIVKKRHRRTLRDIARSTNSARDAEVALAWVRTLEAELAPVQRSGWAWLMQRLAKEVERSYGGIEQPVLDAFDRCAMRLRKRLRPLAAAESDDDDAMHFGTVAAERLERHASDLDARLARISSAQDAVSMHEARIATKRMRYLLEPIARHCDAAGSPIAALRQLQDQLGEINDCRVLGSRLADAAAASEADRARRVFDLLDDGVPLSDARRAGRRYSERPGLYAIASSLIARRDRCFAAVATAWLGRPDPTCRLDGLTDLLQRLRS
jgi:CHAD domain-containing protein